MPRPPFVTLKVTLLKAALLILVFCESGVAVWVDNAKSDYVWVLELETEEILKV